MTKIRNITVLISMSNCEYQISIIAIYVRVRMSVNHPYLQLKSVSSEVSHWQLEVLSFISYWRVSLRWMPFLFLSLQTLELI